MSGEATGSQKSEGGLRPAGGPARTSAGMRCAQARGGRAWAESRSWPLRGLLCLLAAVLLIGLGGCVARSSGTAAGSPSGAPVPAPVQLRSLGPWLGASGRGMGVVSFELENVEQREHSGSVLLGTDAWRVGLQQSVPFRLDPGEKRRFDVRIPAFAISDGDLSLNLYTQGVGQVGYHQIPARGHVRGAATRILIVELSLIHI